MFVQAIQSSKNSIFPIIQTISKNGHYVNRNVAGTGFFIDDKGHFVTALHVVGQIGNPDFSFGSLGNVPYANFNGIQPEEIIEVGRIPKMDLFIGHLTATKLSPLKLVDTNPPEGRSIVIGGYPFPNITKLASGGLNFYTVRQYWQSAMIMDHILLSHFIPTLSYNGFLVDNRAIPGMSGGPALNLKGQVVGMCTAQITRAGKDRVPNINGVCLDAKSLYEGIHTILSKVDRLAKV